MGNVERLALRRAQIGACVAATGVDGFAFGPLLAACGPELVDELWVGTSGDFDRLSLETVGAGEAFVDHVRQMMIAYDVNEDAAAAVQEYALLLPDSRLRVTVTEQVGAAEPSVRLAFDGAITRHRLAQILAHAQLPEAARDEADRMFGHLLADEASAFAMVFDRPTATPSFAVDVTVTSTQAEIATRAASIEGAAAAVGATAPQGRWMRGAFPSLAPRAFERHVVRFGVGASGPTGPLQIRFADLPARLPLRMIAEFNPTPARAPGVVLGALSGAVGVTDEVVSVLQVGLRDVHPPEVALQLRAGWNV